MEATVIPTNTQGIPAELKQRRQWVLWRTIERDGKKTKAPFQVWGTAAKSSDPATWDSFEAVVDAYRSGKWDGIGYVFAASDPYVGIDLDGCRDPESGAIAPWAQPIIARLGTYTEVSPSGSGVKLWVRGKSPFPTGKNRKIDEAAMGGKSAGIEVYDRKRFFAMTGQRLEVTPASIASRDIAWLKEEFWPEPKPKPRHEGNGRASDVVERARKYAATVDPAVSGQGGHNTTFRLACELVNGFDLGVDAARPILYEYSQRCMPPWSDREVEHKLESAAKEPGPRGYRLNGRKAAPSTPTGSSLPPGTRVRAGDRGNIGDVVEDCGASVRVHFTSRDGQQAVKELPKSELTALDGAPLGDVAGIELPPVVSLPNLVRAHPILKPALIHGFLRLGETANIVAHPKAGKSWLGNGLALSVAAGIDWLGVFRCEPGRVLVIDAELHAENIAHRLPMVADAMGLDSSYLGQIDVWPLRGVGADLHSLGPRLAALEPDTYALIILDAWYRFLPPGISENDNAAIMALYNRIDSYAAHSNAAWVNIHHASKGEQSGKGITDVGSGAGAQSRAADSHMIIRPHETEGVAVVEAVVRSWPPVDRLAIQWDFPIWMPAPEADPRRLAGPKRGGSAETIDSDKQEIVNTAYGQDPQTKTVLRNLVTFGHSRFDKAFAQLVKDGTLIEDTTTGKRGQTYAVWRVKPCEDI